MRRTDCQVAKNSKKDSIFYYKTKIWPMIEGPQSKNEKILDHRVEKQEGAHPQV